MENNENNVQNQVNETVNPTQKSGKKATIILGTIVLILVLAVGVCAGLLISENGNKIINRIEEKIVQSDDNKTSKKIDESKDWVYDADYLKENKKFYRDSAKTEEYANNSDKDLVVPYININSDYAKKINEKIKALYDDCYEKYGKEELNAEFKTYYSDVLKYDKYINDNILSVVITLHEYKIVVDGEISRNNETIYTYNFNLDTLNEASLDEMAKKCGFSSETEVTSKIKSWEEKQRNVLSKTDHVEIFSGVENDKYFIDGNGKLNFLYRTNTSVSIVHKESIEKDKEIELFYTEKQAEEQIKINNEAKQNQSTVNNNETNNEEESSKETIWYTCDEFKIKLPKSWENNYIVEKGTLGDKSGVYYSFLCASDKESLFTIQITKNEIQDAYTLLGNYSVGNELRYVYMVIRRDAPLNPEPSGKMMSDFQANKDDIYIKHQFDDKIIYAKDFLKIEKGSMYRYYGYYIDENDTFCIINYENDITIEKIVQYTKKLVYNENDNKIHVYPIGDSFMNNFISSRDIEEVVYEGKM